MSWFDTENCKFCQKPPPCYTHCSETHDGKHAHRPNSLEARETTPIGPKDTIVVDVHCFFCGQSGSSTLKLDPAQISWD